MTIVITGLLWAAHSAAVAADTLDIAKMANWRIVVAHDALPSEKYAAEEFQTLFEQASGMRLPIADKPGRGGNVHIGPGAVAQAGKASFATDDLGDEGVRIHIARRALAIAGGRPRGTLYAVYEFLERYLGVRFLTWDHTHIPDAARTARLPFETFSYVPPFAFRCSYYKENYDRPEFAARLRNNTMTRDEKLGGVTRQGLIGHTMYRWINPEKHGATHPEYLALVDGRRKTDVGGGGPQPCVSNPDVIEIITQGVLDELAADPARQNISVSQNDNDAYCRCPNCEAINQREGTPMGAHLALVNAVAERVEQAYPHVKVGTLAYWYTRKPPKTLVPRKNVQIQLCSIECCTFHAIDDPQCALNREFCADMNGWKAISDEIWIWNYNTNFSCYDLPFPNLRSIGRNVQFFLDSHAKGVFMQANGNGNSGEMCDLRNYVLSRCIWRPGQDSWALAEEFCRLHYGGAAAPVIEYLALIHDNVERQGLHFNCFPSAEQVGLNPGVARQAIALFDRALACAENDTMRNRVEKASIPAYKAMIKAGVLRWDYDNGTLRRVRPEGATAGEHQDLIGKYIALCQKHNMSMAEETRPAADYFQELQRTNDIPAARIENEVWRLTVLPGSNAKMVEMFHKPSGRHLVAGVEHADILRGAHEEVALEGFKSDAAVFKCEQSGQALRLTRTLEDGSTLERKIRLDRRHPGKIQFESCLTHRGAEPKTYCMKAHPEFEPASKSSDWNVVSAYVRDAKWVRFNKDWKYDHGPEDGVLRSARGGAFAFFNHEAGFGVKVTYDPKRVHYPYLWWYNEWPQINLELVSPAVELRRGDSLRLEYAFEYLPEAPR